MDFLNSNDDYFFYGETCRGSDRESYKAFAQKSEKKPFKIRIAKERAGIAKVDTSKVQFAMTSHAPVMPNIQSAYVEDWYKKLRWLDDMLELNQDQLAKILKVSTSTIQKLVSKQTRQPQPSTQEQLRQFVNLVEFVAGKVKGKKFQVRAFLLNPSLALGNVSPIDYMIKNENEYSIIEVEGVLKRVLE